MAKQMALPFSISASIASKPFGLVHSDVWGLSPIPTMGGSHYLVIFVNDFSLYMDLFDA